MTQKLYIPILIILSTILAACQSAANRLEVDKTCTDPRPQVCTMDYTPVCGVRVDQTSKTYSNGCSACSDSEVVGYQEGACP